jgi:NSS family neurotransmitter:Na+ symporter
MRAKCKSGADVRWRAIAGGCVVAQSGPGREAFGSRLGFVLSTAGAAIGLGNLWRFPWLCGMNGGGAFVIIYLAITLLVGIGLFMCEVSLGRATRRSSIGAFGKIRKSWRWAGALGPLASFFALCFYSVVGGWVICYFLHSLAGFGSMTPSASAELFASLTSAPVLPLAFHGIFIGATMVICLRGVRDGIERFSTVMTPLLFVLVFLLALRALALPGSGEGLRFYLIPDFSKVTAATFRDALGQVFFSLSIGTGSILTYGSYLGKQENIPMLSAVVSLMDTAIAFMAGLIIFPVAFSYGFQPTAGMGLTFITLPAVFGEMPAGNLFGVLFFFLFLVAALTSSISYLETIIACLIEANGWGRRRAVILSGAAVFVLGCLSSLSLGPLRGLAVGGRNLFEVLDWLAVAVFQPLAGMVIAILVGWVWGKKHALHEVTNGGEIRFRLGNAWIDIILKVIAPFLVGLIFLAGLSLI